MGEAEANARLISAAPDLLEACEAHQEQILHQNSCKDCLSKVELCVEQYELAAKSDRLRIAAIAKATKAEEES
jgi:hypothetical protein